MSSNKHLFITTDLAFQPILLARLKAFLISECAKHKVNVHELTHTLDPNNLYEAALTARSCLSALPPNSTLIVYVRGSSRQARHMVVQRIDGERLLIVPDNGLISLVWNNTLPENVEVYPITTHYISPVFEYLQFALNPHNSSPLRNVKPITVYMPKAIIDPQNRQVRGQVIVIDRLGNVIFNVTADDLSALDSPLSTLQVSLFSGYRFSLTLCRHGYFDAEGIGSPVLYFNDLGYLEFAVFGDNAAKIYGLCVGDEVVFSVPQSRLL